MNKNVKVTKNNKIKTRKNKLKKLYRNKKVSNIDLNYKSTSVILK